MQTSDMSVLTGTLTGLFFILLWLIIFLLTFGAAARSLGYSWFWWAVASILCSNPLALLYLLASLPNRSLDQVRAKERDLLRQKLAQKGIKPQKNKVDSPPTTLGDMSTTE
jgi:hypothetical protein